MNAYLLDNGNMLIPVRAEGPGGIVGDGMVQVTPGTKEYREWAPYAKPLPEKWAKLPEVTGPPRITATV